MKPHRRDALVLVLLTAACQPAHEGDDDGADPTDPSDPARGAFFLPTTVPDNTSAPAVAVDAVALLWAQGALLADGELVLHALGCVRAKPRNPRHFDGIGGGRKRISDAFIDKNSVSSC